MKGLPKFIIERAELLIDCDNDGTIRFLTNKALLSSKTELEFSRLQSPSLMVKMPLKVLKSLQGMNKEESMREIETQTSCKLLVSDQQYIMMLFRTESYQFPHIEASLASEDRGLTLRFFGADRPAIALYFSLVDIKHKPVVKDSS